MTSHRIQSARAPRTSTAIFALAALAAAAAACFSGHDSKRDPTGHEFAPPPPPRTAAKEQCATTPSPITTQGIGPVLIGARISAVAVACEIRDSAITLGEGMTERSHFVAVGGGHVIALSTGSADTSITRVIVRDSVLRTGKGIHVGSTVGALRAAHGRVCASVGEGNVVAFADSIPGVSFETNVSPGELHGGAAAVEKDATVLPDAATIDAIWVTGAAAPCLKR
ncbi:MAG: hypothetical protein ACJ79K_01970 [Gemmatimonadaceae bacterium]